MSICLFIFISLFKCLTILYVCYMSVCLSNCLSVCLSVCLPACLSVCLSLSLSLSVCLSVSLSVCLSLSLSLSVCLSICLSMSVCLSVCLSLSLSLSVCLSVCLSICLSMSVCLSVSLSISGMFVLTCGVSGAGPRALWPRAWTGPWVRVLQRVLSKVLHGKSSRSLRGLRVNFTETLWASLISVWFKTPYSLNKEINQLLSTLLTFTMKYRQYVASLLIHSLDCLITEGTGLAAGYLGDFTEVLYELWNLSWLSIMSNVSVSDFVLIIS